MKIRRLHAWDVTPADARRIQEWLRARAEREGAAAGRWEKREPKFVAGADVAFLFEEGEVGRRKKTSAGVAIAGVILYRWPEMVEVERVAVRRRLRFPYVPGLLSFREAPALLAAFAKLKRAADVIFVDGQGTAHPRRFGIACHLGMLLGCAAIGCAKSRLIGTHEELGREAGSWTALRNGGEVVGAVVRTRAGAKPIYVSPGYGMTLKRAIAMTIAACDGYRIPRPTREADGWVESAKRSGAKRRVRGEG